MPVGERLFRRLWLGAFGRWFLARAARGLTPSATASTGTTGASSTAVQSGSSVPSAAEATLGDLDRRVRALEQWKRSQSGAG